MEQEKERCFSHKLSLYSRNGSAKVTGSTSCTKGGPVSAIDLIEPATGERLASIPRATAEDVDRAARAAERAFAAGPWRSMNTRDRGRVLFRLAQLIRDHADELALEAGVPEGVFTVVTGSGSVVGEALIRHPAVRKVSFTGSTEVGARVMQVAANDIKRVSLELGGKSANIIFADSDFARAVASAASSSLGNAGQDCCARSRVLVERSL